MICNLNDHPIQMNDEYGLQLLECRDTIAYDYRNYEGIAFDSNINLDVEEETSFS